MNENTQQPAATAHSEESRQWEECVAKLSLDEGTGNKVRHLIEQIGKGEVDETTVSILSHAVNHDEEMKNAETEGYLRGRNEKIDNATRPTPKFCPSGDMIRTKSPFSKSPSTRVTPTGRILTARSPQTASTALSFR